AVKAALRPGAVVETPDGISPAQAVGLAESTSATAVSENAIGVNALPQNACSFWDAKGSWGLWPYHQDVRDQTYWCERHYAITYRSTTVLLDGLLCGHHDPGNDRIGGGIGWFYVETNSWGNFDCQTAIPWIVYHYLRQMHLVHRGDGSAAITWMS